MTSNPILIAAPGFHEWDLGTYVEAALLALGHRSARFDWNQHAAPGPAFVRAVRDHKAHLVIGLKLDGIPPGSIRAARRAGARVLLWQLDCFTPAVPRWIRPRVAAVDAVAITAGGMVDAYRRHTTASVAWVMEGAFLPAFRQQRLSRHARATYGSEIAFVGNLGQPPVPNRTLAGRRIRLIGRLARTFDVRVWGPQPPAAIRAARRSGIVVRRWPAYHAELVKICEASAIVLGINTVNSVPHYFSNRTFLTLASGGFHVTHYVPGLEDLFQNHRHLVWFHDDDECVDVCGYYLRRPARRRAIAERGRAMVRTHWSLTRQVGRLLEILERVDAPTGAAARMPHA